LAEVKEEYHKIVPEEHILAVHHEVPDVLPQDELRIVLRENESLVVEVTRYSVHIDELGLPLADLTVFQAN